MLIAMVLKALLLHCTAHPRPVTVTESHRFVITLPHALRPGPIDFCVVLATAAQLLRLVWSGCVWGPSKRKYMKHIKLVGEALEHMHRLLCPNQIKPLCEVRTLQSSCILYHRILATK